MRAFFILFCSCRRGHLCFFVVVLEHARAPEELAKRRQATWKLRCAGTSNKQRPAPTGKMLKTWEGASHPRDQTREAREPSQTTCSKLVSAAGTENARQTALPSPFHRLPARPSSQSKDAARLRCQHVLREEIPQKKRSGFALTSWRSRASDNQHSRHSRKIASQISPSQSGLRPHLKKSREEVTTRSQGAHRRPKQKTKRQVRSRTQSCSHSLRECWR